MNFTYENQGTNTYLVYTLSEEESIDTMSLGMLSNNKIPGLASTLFTQMDATKYIKYNVSAKIPVSQFFAGAVNKKRLLGVFKGIVSAIMSAEEYMIDESTILLDLDYIFADVTTCETVLICLPVDGAAKQQDLGAFFKGIMFSTQFDQTENCDHVAKLINYLNSSPLFSLVDFNEVLDKIEKDGHTATAAEPKAQPVVTTTVPTQAKLESKPAVQPNVVQQAPAQVQKHENLQFGANYNPTESNIPPVAKPKKNEVPVQQNSEPVKSKGFSLFGLFSRSEKKETKPQVSKQPVAAQQRTNFEVPGVQSQKLGFEVPGQSNANTQPTVPANQTAAPTAGKVVNQPITTQPNASAQPVVTAQPVNASVQQPAQKSRPANFGETTVLGGAVGETTVLGSAASPVKADPHLIRTKNNERIPLNKPVFRIGKERSYVDYFISDNTAISRSHANIINHNGEFFVVDTNSTNHTYVNGTMIHSNEEVKLSHGSKIRLANEDFEFRLY